MPQENRRDASRVDSWLEDLVPADWLEDILGALPPEDGARLGDIDG